MIIPVVNCGLKLNPHPLGMMNHRGPRGVIQFPGASVFTRGTELFLRQLYGLLIFLTKKNKQTKLHKNLYSNKSFATLH